MRIFTAEEMRAAEGVAIDDWGIPSLVLMENAALGATDALCARYSEATSVVVFCGPGNNGGDGLAVARHLAIRHFSVRVLLLDWDRNRSENASIQLEICRRQGLPITPLSNVEELRDLAPEGLAADLWVDAIFGTGLSRPLEGLFEEAARWLASHMAPVIAVDLPSGLDASSAEPIGPCASADLTVTFGAPKLAHVLAPAAEKCGEVVVTDLGVPEQIFEDAPGHLHLLTAGELGEQLQAPSPDSHKGSFGHCLVVGGSKGKAGAAVLAARAAVRSGAGLVTLAVPEPVAAAADLASLESMTLALASDQSGGLTVDAADEVLEALGGKQSLAVGPGLGTSGTTIAAVLRLLEEGALPTVVDADALNALAGHIDILQRRKAPTVLTPHPGEAARLFGVSVESIQADRIGFARSKATTFGVTLVLKGHNTLVATAGGQVYVNPTGNAGMATGGSGDVLTGVIAGLLARNHDPIMASCLGVFVHGTAGDLALERTSFEGLGAEDICAALAAGFGSLRSA